MNALTDSVRVQIEQKIAAGWSDTGISRHLSVSVGSVHRVRRWLDSIVDLDVWTLFERRAATNAGNRCSRGHRFTADNTYRRPDGRRECRTCKDDRNRARYEAAAA